MNGKPFAEYRRPLAQVGSPLEARALYTGRSARNHLLAIAATAGIGAQRIGEVIEMITVSQVARRRAGAFSLGIAAARDRVRVAAILRR